MLFHSIYQRDSSAYFVQSAYRLIGDLNVRLVEYSLNELIRRHEILRTSFVYEEMDKPLQVVLSHRKLPFYFEDISNLSSKKEQEDRIEAFKKEDRKHYFDLVKDSLIRAAVFRISDSEHEFIWSCHHIIIDGWSLKTIEKEFFAIYESAGADRTPSLPPPVQYRNYIDWLENKPSSESAEFWKKYLLHFDAPSPIPRLLRSEEPESAFDNRVITFELPDTLHQNLLEVARKNRTTLNNIFRTLWGLLLAKYNDQRDAVFGAVVSGRPPQLPDSDEIVGLFINTVPVRVAFDAETGFGDLVRRVSTEAADSEEFHHYPLAEIQNASELKQHLFDHIVVFENYPVNAGLPGLKVGTETGKAESMLELIRESVFSQNHYPFYIIVGTKPVLRLNFYYNRELYTEDLVRDLFGQFCLLAEQAISQEAMPVDRFGLVEEDGKQHHWLLDEVNDTQKVFEPFPSVHSLFERTAAAFPDKTAIRSEMGSYSYLELNGEADALAAHLIDQLDGQAKGKRIAILVDRYDYALIGMLAAARSGAAFVPIHPELPGASIRNILQGAQPAVLLTESTMLEHAEGFPGELFAMDIQLDMLDRSGKCPEVSTGPDDPLYLIYSSGTTGKPKGVMVSHGALLNYVSWFKSEFDFSQEYRGALLSSYAFDLGYTAIWGTLLSGATLFLPDKNTVRNPDSLLTFLLENQISFLKLTPSHFKILMASGKKASLASSALKLVLLGGEKINVSDLAAYLEINPSTQFVNHYGPTEATIGAVFHRIDPDNLDAYGRFPVIGRPIANAGAHILDDNGNLLPVGAKGQLCLGGKGLAIGYFGNDELTQQKFTVNARGQRIYKTGDRARRMPGGEIEFLGRIDQEVKIRGYRIDTNEIDQVLLSHPEVAFASVQPFEEPGGGYALTAFIQYRDDPDSGALLAFLRTKLPDYMVPGQLTAIQSVPITPNGKLDVKALRKMKQDNRAKTVIPPETDLEEGLLAIWQEVLGHEKISMDDDFFDLGGHSLKAVQIISRIISEFRITLEVKDIFDHTTIRQLAAEVGRQIGIADTGRSMEEIII